jgi:hypothetical protein
MSVYKWKQHRNLTKHKDFELVDPEGLSAGGGQQALRNTPAHGLQSMPCELGVVLDYDPLSSPDSADEADIVDAVPL